MAVAFDIVVSGVPPRAVRCALAELAGGDHVRAEHGSLRITVADQAAMVGIINRLHDLGLQIELVERSRVVSAHGA